MDTSFAVPVMPTTNPSDSLPENSDKKKGWKRIVFKPGKNKKMEFVSHTVQTSELSHMYSNPNNSEPTSTVHVFAQGNNNSDTTTVTTTHADERGNQTTEEIEIESNNGTDTSGDDTKEDKKELSFVLSALRETMHEQAAAEAAEEEEKKQAVATAAILTPSLPSTPGPVATNQQPEPQNHNTNVPLVAVVAMDDVDVDNSMLETVQQSPSSESPDGLVQGFPDTLPVPGEASGVVAAAAAAGVSLAVAADGEDNTNSVVHATPGSPTSTSADHEAFKRDLDELSDIETHSANLIAMQKINVKDVQANLLGPREQERADEPVLRGIRHFFNNRFMKAKTLFETKADSDPLFALGLGAMAFMKGLSLTLVWVKIIGKDHWSIELSLPTSTSTFHEDDIKIAIDTLTETYSLANAQIDAAAPKKPLKESVSQYIATYYQFFTANNTGLPATPPPLSSEEAAQSQFLSNGVLRAHVVKAECCLLIAMMQLSQESIVGYLKCGLNLRRAYNSYSLVWQEYKKMGQAFNDHMDRDTISGIQFGIGSVHLLLSTLPTKILKIVAAFGWKADKHLGFALLKLCLEGRRIRSPLASLMLLAYYTILTSFAPQVLAKEYTQPAIETLLDAQRNYPNSAFFLYFAGRTSRLARNISLSTQSYLYATEISRGEWAEVEVRDMCDYEIGFNHAMNLDWESASKVFEGLYTERYWSPAFCKYVHGACLEIMGHRTEAILAFAQVPQLVVKKFGGRMIYIEQYVLRKVEFFQSSGYQDMDFSVPALELLAIWNCYEFMEREHLEKCLECVESALEKIAEREKLEYEIRIRELAPTTPPPNYFDQRGTLLLVKSSIQNALHRYLDSIVNLNWILDHKDLIKQDRWVVAFTYWEAGVTTWGLGEKAKSRKFWETALLCSKYEFEYRLAVRLNLGIMRCEEMGIFKTEEKKPTKGPSTGGRKRMSVVTSVSSRADV